MIDINVFATNSYLYLIQKILLPSIVAYHPGAEVNVLFTEKGALPNIGGSTHDPQFKDLMTHRMAHYLRVLKKNKGKKVLFLDGDIIILQPFLHDLEERLDNYDILHQGGGILAFNSNEHTIKLFEDFVNQCIATKPEDRPPGFPEFELQAAFKEYYDSSLVSLLPEQYGYLCEDPYMYHAMNSGNTMPEKMVILTWAEQIAIKLRNVKPTESERFKRFKKNKENILFGCGYVKYNDPADPSKGLDYFAFDSSKTEAFVDLDIIKAHADHLYFCFEASWDNEEGIEKDDKIVYFADMREPGFPIFVTQKAAPFF
tara:strand:- start:8156 stop:9097 length:942 start_codon:yes stop_codon:yes gene_type:complete